MRVFSFRTALSDTCQDAVLDEIRAIREGNMALRSQFIKKYSNFILSMASKVKGRYIEVENDEEYSIALAAFDRAIDCFHQGKGATFLAFAALLIKRDIIDLYRKNGAIREIAVSQLKDKENDTRDSLSSSIMDDAERVIHIQEEQFNLKQEITIYKALLSEYSIDFSVLISATPKQVTARRSMIRVAKVLSEDPFLSACTQNQKSLPMKDLESRVDISRRTLQRHRLYILASFILFTSDLDYLKDYIKNVLQEGEEA